MPLQWQPPPFERGPLDQVLLPAALHVVGLVEPIDTAPLQLRFFLKGGFELDIPLTQDAIDAAAQILDGFRSKP